MNNWQRRARALATLLACGAAGAALGADPGEDGFAAALRRAAAQRTELAIEREQIHYAGLRVADANAAFKPVLVLTSAIENGHRYDTFSGVTASATFAGQPVSVDIASDPPRYRTKFGLELAYNLYRGGADQARLAEARAQGRSAQAQLGLTTRQVLLDAAAACAENIKARLAYRQARRALALAQRERDFTGERLQSGAASAIDMDDATIRLQSHTIALRSAKRNLAEARRKYCAATNSTCRDEDAEADRTEPDLGMPDLGALFAELGVDTHAETDKAQADAAASAFRLAQVRAEYAPEVNVFARHTFGGHSDDGFAEARSGFKREESVIGFRINWILYDGHRTANRSALAVSDATQVGLRAAVSSSARASARRATEDAIGAYGEQIELATMAYALLQKKQALSSQRLALKVISALDHAKAEFATASEAYHLDTLRVDLVASRIRLAIQ